VAEGSQFIKYHCIGGSVARFSSKPRKQRKLLYDAPAHRRHRRLAASLSPELQAKYNLRSFPVRKGDTGRILRGDYTGIEGKITRVDTKGYRVYIEGVTKEKADGTTVQVPVSSSKITLAKLNLDDKWRKKALEEKAEVPSSTPVTAKTAEAYSKPTQSKEA